MPDENATSLQDANQKVIRDMVKCAETKMKGPGLGEAMSYIIDVLQNSTPMKNFHLYVNSCSNQVVEVENIFEGQTGDKQKWEARFTINADLANEKLKQKAHFGCDISFNNERVITTHKWLPDDILKVGRPTDRSAQLEEFETGKGEKQFDKIRYATWRSLSKKYR